MSRRILWASDHPRFHTGYGAIGQALLPRWAQEHEVGVLGWHAPAAAPSPDPEPWSLFPGGDWEAGRLAEVLHQFQPEVLITLGNLSMLALVPEGRADWAGVWVGYFPIEGSPLPGWRLRLVQDMDRAVTFTRYAVAALCQAGFEGPVDCLPLGVDPDVFRPLPYRADLRSAWGLADRFIVGCVARNQPRKQLPILLRAFAQFAQGREEAFLYLHTDPDDVGWDLIELGQRYGIADRLGFTAELAFVLGVSDEELNEIYNLFDVFALPSMAEGFGLPLLEAMATGVPVVTTDYAAGAELVRGRGALIRVAQWITGDGHNTDLALADEDHLVEILEHLYAHPEERDRLARTGRAYAEEWTWERCHAAWESLLEELPGAAEARRRRPVRAITLQCSDDLEKVYLAAESALVTLHERYPRATLTFQTASRHHRLVEVCAAQSGIALRIAPPLAPPSQGGDCGLRIADCGNWEIRKLGCEAGETGKLGSWETGELVSVDLGEASREALEEQWAAACGGPLTRRPRRLTLPVEDQAAALAFLQAQGWQPGDILVGVLGEETGKLGNWETGKLGNWAALRGKPRLIS
jgi:glycosyltransferase involved in cell wall biosynthesis